MKALTWGGRLIVGGILLALLLIAGAIGMRLHHRRHAAHGNATQGISTLAGKYQPDINQPVRPIPDSFPRNTHMPDIREGTVSGSVDAELFSPGRDLIYVDDDRVWWESDHDTDDTECDHSMHKSAEIPFRRLVELVCQRGGRLEVHDAYRPAQVHNARSLHKEGRAIDLTCDELGLEMLASLCWAAGFDWVYYEASAAGGAHVHVSVRRDHPEEEMTWAQEASASKRSK